MFSGNDVSCAAKHKRWNKQFFAGFISYYINYLDILFLCFASGLEYAGLYEQLEGVHFTYVDVAEDR